MKPALKTAIKIGLSAVLLGVFATQAGLENIGEQLQQANLWWILPGVAIYLVSQGVSAYRWQFLSRPVGIVLSWATLFRLYMLGMFYSLFLPGSIGGDVVRMYYMSQLAQARKRNALLTLLAERGVGLVAMLILVGALMLVPEIVEVVPWVIRLPLMLLAASGLLGYLLLWVLPIQRWAQPKDGKDPNALIALLAQAEVYWRDTGLLTQSVLLSMVVHGCMVLIHVLMLQAFGLTGISIPFLIVTYGLVTLMSVLPLFFNGLGVREGTYVSMLALVGVDPATAMAFGVYWFVISSLTSLVGGWFFIQGSHHPTSSQSLQWAADA